ncbi:hypothetical protein [Streptomyces sp. NBC_00370]|uniref:hypothetical protein n=1 Tax=Streptomyces sp. NBC_00370 TaxID=2975728 RepID=UPI002E263B9A
MTAAASAASARSVQETGSVGRGDDIAGLLPRAQQTAEGRVWNGLSAPAPWWLV